VNSRDHGSAQAKTIHRVVRVDVRRIVLQTLLFGVALSVLLATPVVIYQQAETRNLLNLREAEQERVIKLAAQSIRQEMDAVLSDLRYLSQHNEIRTYLEKPDRSHRRDLANEYLVLAKQKRIYDHIRFIGIDGKEAVRVDFADGKPKIRPEQDLQNKRDRYYFQETQWLAPGQIFVSPFDLNVEQGAIEQPLKPTIRFAVPVADDQGQIRGMVVLNYLGQRLIDKLGLLAGQAGNIWLLNAKGDWLIGPTRQDEWGFMYRPRPNAAPYLDAFRRQVMQEKSGFQNTEATSIRFERIYPLTSTNLFPNSLDFAQPEAANRYYWTLAASRSPSSLKASNTFMPQASVANLRHFVAVCLSGGWQPLLFDQPEQDACRVSGKGDRQPAGPGRLRRHGTALSLQQQDLPGIFRAKSQANLRQDSTRGARRQRVSGGAPLYRTGAGRKTGDLRASTQLSGHRYARHGGDFPAGRFSARRSARFFRGGQRRQPGQAI
jgi:hypothetical protein